MLPAPSISPFLERSRPSLSFGVTAGEFEERSRRSMEVGGGGGGPAPFLLKTYDMIEDKSTDNIVCWSSNGSSFVVLDPPEFSRILLPTYFKHNNFSSFIRQLNTYGFRKMDPEKWEFANDDFIRGEKQLMKNIHRRKPIHSHSLPPLSTSGSDLERETLEAEIERVTREKNALVTAIFKGQQYPSESQLQDLEARIKNMEQRQQNMTIFLMKALKNPVFVDNLLRLINVRSNDLTLIRKKRRRALPKNEDENNDDDDEDDAVCNFSCDDDDDGDLSERFKGSELGTHMFQQDFNSKLKLESSPTILNTDVDFADAATGPSFLPRKNSVSDGLSPWHSSLMDCSDDVPCHLNLTLASSSPSPLQLFNNKMETDGGSGGDINQASEEDLKNNNTTKKTALLEEDGIHATASSPPVVSMPVAGKNDLFWEQFLTERPGSSDTEESNSHEDREKERGGSC